MPSKKTTTKATTETEETKKAAPKKATTKKAAPKKAASAEVAPKETAPKKAAPKKAASEEVAPKETAPKKAATKKAAPKETAPKEAAPKKTAKPRKAVEEDVKIEKTADGVIEVKKMDQSQNTAEELSIEQKLLSLYNLQQICSKIDDIRMIRGELPEEIRDKEDECEGKRTRIANLQEEIKNLRTNIAGENAKKSDATSSIKRYEEQQNNVRNNREYESLSKEIDYQNLEIQVADKHIAKFEAEIAEKEAKIKETQTRLAELEEILKQKKEELEVIVADTEKEEAELTAKAEELRKKVDERLLTAFERIRKNAHNGLAIVKIDRDACGGCFSKIPPQRQLDIALHKKIIVCEACGRIFIDDKLVNSQAEAETEVVPAE